MKPRKVKLRKGEFSSGSTMVVYWTECLPFVENKRGVLIHRPVQVSMHKCGKRPVHLGVHYWCGAVATGRDNFTFLSKPPNGKLVCTHCEAKAVAAGELTADKLVGRHVHRGRVKAVRACCVRKRDHG